MRMLLVCVECGEEALVKARPLDEMEAARIPPRRRARARMPVKLPEGWLRSGHDATYEDFWCRKECNRRWHEDRR